MKNMIGLNNYLTFKNGGQKVFVVIKPGFLNLCDKIIERMKDSGWEVFKTTVKKLQLKEAKQLYKIHEKESFYEDLCKYMASDVSRAFIFEKYGSRLDEPFDVVAKIKNEIRNEYGESDMRNVMHSSDSEESMLQEAKIYFNL